MHKIVFTIFRDTNYVFRWIFILFKCSRSFVDFIYIWDTKLVINLCKKLMNDNLYQSKAGVFTLVGSCGLPSPSHPQDKSELWWCIVIVGWSPAPLCSGASLACLSIGVQQPCAMYGRSHFLFLVFHLSTWHSATKSQSCSQTSIVYRNGLAAWMVKYPRNKSATVLATLSHFSIHTPAAGGQSWCWWRGRALFWSSVPRDSRGRHKHLFRASLHLFHFWSCRPELCSVLFWLSR